MDLEKTKVDVFEANLLITAKKLAILNFGNLSARVLGSETMVIKPSGIDLRESAAEDMVEVCIDSGEILRSRLRPSSDTKTHLAIYQAFPDVKAVAHTHSPFATAWAQASMPVPCYGTTHADFFAESIPVTRPLTEREIDADYERETGKVIVETFRELDPLRNPGVLVAHHGPFVWGRSPVEAVQHAEAVEFIAKLASLTLSISPQCGTLPPALSGKHFSRKHGPTAYYGQKSL